MNVVIVDIVIVIIVDVVIIKTISVNYYKLWVIKSRFILIKLCMAKNLLLCHAL